MTDNTAPETIWAWRFPGKQNGGGWTTAKISYAEAHFIRADLSDAAIAAAYADAKQQLNAAANGTPVGQEDRTKGASTYNWLRHCSDLIKIPADARAALEAAKREAFNEGIEAAARCGDKAIEGYAGRCRKGDRYALGVQAGVERFSRAIRALLKEEQTDD